MWMTHRPKIGAAGFPVPWEILLKLIFGFQNFFSFPTICVFARPFSSGWSLFRFFTKKIVAFLEILICWIILICFFLQKLKHVAIFWKDWNNFHQRANQKKYFCSSAEKRNSVESRFSKILSLLPNCFH